jgi:succinate-semialdehyde dehydrogenase/glutarate-semialdehyde dehydrogenase
VFHDASLENAVTGLMAAKFRASGQTCVCANRVYVQEGIYDRFVSAFAEKVQQSMHDGSSNDPQTTLGCLINDKAVQKVERLVKNAIELGAEIVLGGKKEHGKRGNFYPATILKDMTADMDASRQEIFGPVVSFFKFGTEEEVLKLANQAEVGLASYVFTNNLPLAWRMAEALKSKPNSILSLIMLISLAGMTGINTGVISDPVAPFGGVKHSGFGREGGKQNYHPTKIL